VCVCVCGMHLCMYVCVCVHANQTNSVPTIRDTPSFPSFVRIGRVHTHSTYRHSRNTGQVRGVERVGRRQRIHICVCVCVYMCMCVCVCV